MWSGVGIGVLFVWKSGRVRFVILVLKVFFIEIIELDGFFFGRVVGVGVVFFGKS